MLCNIIDFVKDKETKLDKKVYKLFPYLFAMKPKQRYKEWKPYTAFKYVAFICVSAGLCMIYIGNYLFINTNIHYLLGMTSNSNTYVLYRILWFAPPNWVENRTTTTTTEYCEYTNCEITFNKSEIERSVLVIFHHNNMNIYPPNKTESQKWVFACVEAPRHAYEDYLANEWRDKFDWTMTYRTDSEGFAPYGTIFKNKFIKERNYSSIYRKKNKDVAIVESNCDTPSKRDQFVAEMNKIINVDIFGRCGSPCPDDCFEHISEKYKFYLSFENSLCTDYVTEKFFRIYKEDLDLIPVVRGAPNVKQLLPGITFISASDYTSPATLAHDLKDIGSHETKYVAWLKSKHEYLSTCSDRNMNENGMCSLCKKLNRNFKRRTRLNILEVMSPSQCFDPIL